MKPGQVEQGSQAVSSPEPIPVNKFSLNVTISDFSLASGCHRLAYGPEGQVLGRAVEYAILQVMSPGSAKQLKLMLEHSLSTYEAQHGEIPVEQGFLDRLQAATKSSSKTSAAASKADKGSAAPGAKS